MIVKEGRRIILRQIQKSDLESLWHWRNDPRFMNLCSARRQAVGFDDFKQELAYDFSHDRHVQCVIIRKKDAAHMGTIFSCRFNQSDGYLFVTTYLDGKYEKKGYGAWAFGMFCQHLFENYALHKIYTEVYDYNNYSLRTMLNAGLLEEGRLREHRLFQGQRKDLLILAFYRNKLDALRQFNERVNKPRPNQASSGKAEHDSDGSTIVPRDG